jgi:WD40 repeat protein
MASRHSPPRVLSDQPGALYSVAFSADGSQLVAAGKQGVTLWETRGWTVQRRVAGEFRSSAFTRDGQTFVAATKAGVTGLATAQGTGPFRLPDASGPAVFSSDGLRLATLSRRGIEIWDSLSLSSNATPLLVIPWPRFDHSGEHELAFSPDGQIIAAGDNDGRVALFNSVSGQKLAGFGHSGRVDSLAFSPDGRILASTGADQTLRLWDVATNTDLATLRGHQNAVWSVAFSPDGALLATGSKDQTVKLWHAGASRPADDWQVHGPHSRISTDAATLVHVHDSQAQWLNVHTRAVLASFTVPDGARTWDMFPGSQTVAVITSNWCVQVWNLATKTENVPFQIPREFQLPPELMPDPPRFSPDGHALAMGGADSLVR